jgi:asparagine synthase (glutamine-hydrolysing)
MCRLFGNIGNNLIDQSLFEKLTMVSKRGGPDSTEFFRSEEAQFGFNRLAILDTSENGNQPFTSIDQRYTLMLNGEVYNYLNLKNKYQLYDVKSGSDAEVVLHLIQRTSFEKAIVELNGMFAISCWDAVEKKLYLARDFAGIKPLFYASTINGIVFGSQFNQILKHPWCANWEMSEVGLSEYLQFGYMLPPNTIADNVNQLNVGEYLVYSLASKTYITVKYKKFFEKLGNIPDDKSINIGKVIENAVSEQMVSDVPLGVFLSGGIDSTLVTAKALKFNPNISAITIGFEDPKYDESQKAIEYAKYLGIKKHEVIKLDNQQLLDIYEDHFEAMTEPIADYSSLPTYLVSQIARKTNTVMLSGDGGDELFWGYPRFLTFANSLNYFRIPGVLPRKITKKLLKSLGKNITGFLTEPNLGAANLAFQSYLDPTKIQELTSNYHISNHTQDGYKFESLKKRDALNYLRRNEFYFHLQKILVKVDRMSMANSLEVRVPLLDRSVIEASENYYSRLGTSHMNLKQLIKEDLYTFLPKSLVEKQKRGFTPPLLTWSKNELKDEIIIILNSHSDKLRFNDIGKEEILKGYFEDQSISIEALWTIYTLMKWLKIHVN